MTQLSDDRDSVSDECASNPCLFGANCTNGPTPNTYTCECPVNALGQHVFEGVNCQNRTDIDLCTSAQCDDCVPDYRSNNPLCVCQPGETPSTGGRILFDTFR